MNAFASSRLAGGAGRVGVIAPLVPVSFSANKPGKLSATNVPAGRSAAAAAGTAGQKRKRAASSDALFAEEDDDEEQEEEEEEEPQPQKRPSKAAKAPQAPQPKQRASSSKHAAMNGDDDEEEEADEGGDEAEDNSNSSSKKKKGGEEAAGPKKRRTAPEELSSKKAVAAGLIVTELPKFNIEKKRRDPRFDPLCGDFDPLHFHSHYGWVAEEKQAEITAWQAELRSGRAGDGSKRVLDDEEREEIRANIQRAQQQLAASKRTVGESSLLKAWKNSERKQQKETGKAPFHLKKSEQKKLQLASRYLALKEQKGALQKFMLKKTKEVANRDHKYMPHEGRD